MKKFISIICLFAITFTLFSCGTNDSTSAPASTEEETTEEEIDFAENGFYDYVKENTSASFLNMIEERLDMDEGGINPSYIDPTIIDSNDPNLGGFSIDLRLTERRYFPSIVCHIMQLANEYAEKKDYIIYGFQAMYYPANDKQNALCWRSDDGKTGTLSDSSVDVSSDGYMHFKVPYEDIGIYIDEQTGKNKNVSDLIDATTASQNTLKDYQAKLAFEYYGEELYPYGFTCHWFSETYTLEQSNNGSWTIKVGVTITNEYGASRDAIAEAYINAETECVENFVVY